MIPKEIKYNLHYDDVRGDFLRPPHGTTSATVECNKSKQGLPLEIEQIMYKETKGYIPSKAFDKG